MGQGKGSVPPPAVKDHEALPLKMSSPLTLPQPDLVLREMNRTAQMNVVTHASFTWSIHKDDEDAIRQKIDDVLAYKIQKGRDTDVRCVTVIKDGRLEVQAPLGLPPWMRAHAISHSKNNNRKNIVGIRLRNKLEQKKAKA